MLLLDKKTKEDLNRVRSAIDALERRKEAVMKGLLDDLVKWGAQSPPEIAQMDNVLEWAQRLVKERLPLVSISQGFEERLAYLNEYGDNPLLFRVTLRVSERDPLNMINIVWERYGVEGGARVAENGVPMNPTIGWRVFMEGGLVLHDDGTWGVHT